MAGPLQTVERAELCVGYLGTLGVDHPKVVGHLGRIVEDIESGGPFELMKSGDLLARVEEMVSRK